jgi:tRNA(adenine34) deaminase
MRTKMSPTIWNTLKESAYLAFSEGEVPVVAALVRNDEIIISAYNQVETNKNPLAHAECLVLHQSIEAFGKNLSQFDLYVTLEPCPMCAHAIFLTQINRVYFGAYSTDKKCVLPLDMYGIENYGGYNELEFKTLLESFFKTLR